ncbi:MAG: cation:proton antiporter [Clostridia bacterium]|nr:cation:proton antiporter [Clostridia bacterium]MBQ4193967.1 cation:proton antiporter [Clostridia bacterium]
MQTLLALSIAMLAGLLMSRLTKIWNLPAVTAYLVAGILIGPYVLGRLGIAGIGFVSSEDVARYNIISDAALGFIAFAMGSEFRLEDLRRMGKKVVTIAVFQALTATIFVDISLSVVHFLMPDRFPLSAAITLGAIATATAPAATLMVVKQYKADGPLTRLLLPIVALDDVVGLVVFAVSFGIAKALEHGTVDLVSVIVNPLVEVVASLALGSLLGYLFHFAEQFFLSRSKRMSISVTFVFLAVALSMIEVKIGPVTLGFSSLLVCMMMGTVFCNLCAFSAELMDLMDRWSGSIMVLFFVLSGAGLEFAVFHDWAIILVGVVYILFRSLGKIEGAKFAAHMTHCEPQIQKYLGITLLPQAGVSLGMSLTAMSLGPTGVVIRNIALFAVLVYELIGPLMTRIALERAGEISEKPIPPRQQAKLDAKKAKG